MSTQGIHIASNVLSKMQLARIELLRMASNDLPMSSSGEQDFLLGQMLEDGKEAMKSKFCVAVSLSPARPKVKK